VAEVIPPPAPVILDAVQQAHVTALIDSARERTARDLRDELASAKRTETALQAELVALKERSTPQSDAELVETQRQLRAAQAEVVQTREDLKTAAASAALNAAVSRGGFVDSSQAAQLLKGSAALSDGTQASLANLVADFAANNPHMVRSTVMGGVGAKPSAGTAGPERISVSAIFGRSSDARLAMAVMKNSPREYRRLREVARQSGLI
jgi:hypothetical protein